MHMRVYIYIYSVRPRSQWALLFCFIPAVQVGSSLVPWVFASSGNGSGLLFSSAFSLRVYAYAYIHTKVHSVCIHVYTRCVFIRNMYINFYTNYIYIYTYIRMCISVLSSTIGSTSG